MTYITLLYSVFFFKGEPHPKCTVSRLRSGNESRKNNGYLTGNEYRNTLYDWERVNPAKGLPLDNEGLIEKSFPMAFLISPHRLQICIQI